MQKYDEKLFKIHEGPALSNLIQEKLFPSVLNPDCKSQMNFYQDFLCKVLPRHHYRTGLVYVLCRKEDLLQKFKNPKTPLPLKIGKCSNFYRVNRNIEN